MTTQRQIPFARPWIGKEEREAVMDVLNGHILTHGPKCHEFEEKFGAFLGEGAHCVSMSSCMAALHMAYFHFGIGVGDEVLVPAQTHTATVHAVELVGAKPVFVDCDPTTGNIDLDQLEHKISPRTRAISIVHFVGIPCDMGRVMTIARRHRLRVIEDCAIAIGARFRGVHVGLFGDVGCFSFYPVKHITSGEGGMLVSRNPDVTRSIARQRAFGVDRSHTERKIPGMYDVVELGLNYRMSEVQAAIGVAQVIKLPEILSRRQRNFRRLKEKLQSISSLRILDATDPTVTSSHYCLSVVLEGELARRRDEIIFRLNAAGVGTSIYYPQPVPRMTYYRQKYGYDERAYPRAAEISDHSIALPVGPHLSEEDMDYISEQLRSVIGSAA